MIQRDLASQAGLAGFQLGESAAMIVQGKCVLVQHAGVLVRARVWSLRMRE
jgi:hypothetical protein